MDSDIKWIEPITLKFESMQQDESELLKHLRKQVADGIERCGVSRSQARRCVYVIRMTGSFIISYELANSPVLYIGRGNAPKRIASHLRRWLSDVRNFGHDTNAEVRLVIPRRKAREDYFKNVEADLIAMFKKKTGAVPYFNGQNEKVYQGKVRYTETQLKKLRRLIGIGSGNKPWWALKPTRANPSHERYLKGAS